MKLIKTKLNKITREEIQNLNEKKEIITIDTAQEMRKAGYWVVMSSNLKKVIAVDKDEKKMRDLYLQNSRKTKIFSPLRTITISPEKQREYDRIQKMIMRDKVGI